MEGGSESVHVTRTGALRQAFEAIVGPDAVLADPDELMIDQITIRTVGFVPWIFSEVDLSTVAAVEAAFNPTGRCNPGKILPTAKSCVPGELACRPHPLEERGLAQRL